MTTADNPPGGSAEAARPTMAGASAPSAGALLVTQDDPRVRWLADASVRVRLQDEDQLQVVVVHRGDCLELRAQRQATVLAELAGRRARDERLGKPEPERGWLDKRALAELVGSSAVALNATLNRLERSFRELGFVDHPAVVERRWAMDATYRHVRQVRLSVRDVSVGFGA